MSRFEPFFFKTWFLELVYRWIAPLLAVSTLYITPGLSLGVVLAEGLFSCPFSLSLDWLDRPRVAGGLVEHFQRITINTAPSGTYFWGNLSQ